MHKCWTSWWAAFLWEGRKRRVSKKHLGFFEKVYTFWVYNRKIITALERISKKTYSCVQTKVSLWEEEALWVTGEVQRRQPGCLDSQRHCHMKSHMDNWPPSLHSQIEIALWDVRGEGADQNGRITLPLACARFVCRHKQSRGLWRNKITWHGRA